MKKNKHDHKGTKALKITIFFTLMLAPFLAVLFKCAYVTFNKNAKDSYYGETINEVNYTSANSEIELNKEYYLTLSYYTPLIDTAKNIQVSEINNFTSNDSAVITSFETNKDNINNIYILNNGTSNMYISFRQDTNILFNVAVQNKTISFNFYASNEITLTNQYNDFIKVVNYNKYSYLDNAFYYAIDEAMDSQYFAWARTSALYTATSGLTTGLGINTQAIPTLLVYWLILTTIYIIFDIVIESFTYLTHMITSRFEQ